MLHCHVVNDIVVRALQKRAVYRAYRAHALSSHAAGKRHRVAFGNADIEEALWILLLEDAGAGARRHRSGDGHKLRMLRAKGGKPLSKELCPRGRSARLLSCLARHGIVRSQAMPLLLIRFSEGESFALL